MKRFFLLSLALNSVLLATAFGATRPQYGGTLRVMMRASPTTLDPLNTNQTNTAQGEWFAGSNLSRLFFDTLISLNSRAELQPALAVSWQADPGNQRWQFSLRNGVTFSDGSALTAVVVAASLRASNPQWKILGSDGVVTIESDFPNPSLAAELALPRNSIVKRGGNQISGTGPFEISNWDPGKKLTVNARNDYWGGRPFVDSIEVGFGQSLRDQAIALDLRKADIIEAAPVGHLVSTENHQAEVSNPVELVALVFSSAPPSPEDARLRDALSLSIDRAALNNVVLQGGGESSAALLPNWMTGYGFVFPSEANLAHARQEVAEYRQKKPWTVSYDAADPIAKVVADRIVLNARDAGVILQLTTSNADLRLVRAPTGSSDPHVALAGIAEVLNLPRPKFTGNSIDDLYTAESSLLQSRQLIPLLHLRIHFELRPTLRGWDEAPDGSWNLGNVWLFPEKSGTEQR